MIQLSGSIPMPEKCMNQKLHITTEVSEHMNNIFTI